MKYASIVIGLLCIGFAWQQYSKKTTKVEVPQEIIAPPPPPAIIEEPPPPLDAKALKKIRSSTQDTNPTVRWEAVKLLITSEDPLADQYLYSMLHQDTEVSIRSKVVSVLAGRKDQRVLPHLLQALSDTEPAVRLAVLAALVQIGDYSVSPQISRLLYDVDERVRLAALNTLNRLQEKHASDVAKTKLKNAQLQAEYEKKMRKFEEAQKITP